MKHVLQTIRNTTTGNCLNAALASILEIELSAIPNFHEVQDQAQWWSEVQAWAKTIGMQMIYLVFNEHTAICAIPEQVPCVLVGPTKRQALHAVVGYTQGDKGNMTFLQLHDPLDGDGIESVDGIIFFTPIHPERRIKIAKINGCALQP